MIGIVRGLFGLALTAAAILAMTAAAAAQEAPSGTLEFTAWSAAAFFGGARGDGVLTLADGRKYPISVENVKVGAVGASYVKGTGTVYNLKRIEDLEGDYLEGEAGLVAIFGVSGMTMKNEQGVVINVLSTQWGANVTLGFGGMYLRVKSHLMK